VNTKLASVAWTVATITHSTLTYNSTGNFESSVIVARP
jgi:hypothetical protein